MPTPIMTASPDRSSNIPHSFAPSADKMSLGHLIVTPTCGAICLMVSTTASAIMKASDGAGGSSVRKRTMVLANRLPAGLFQTRPIRPRPPSCAAARSHSPSGALRATRSSRSALVEPVSVTSSKIGVRIKPLRLVRRTGQGPEWRDNRVEKRKPPMLNRSTTKRGYRWRL